MESKNRSQITIFMILGIVLLFAFGLLFFIASKNQLQIKASTKETTEPKEISVQNFVQDCLELVGDEAIEWVLIQGGTYEKGYILQYPQIYKLAKPVAKGDDSKAIARTEYEFSKESIKNGIGVFFNDTFDICINDFKDFNLPIEISSYSFNVSAEDNSIFFDLNYPIKIKTAEGELNINEFSYRKDIELGVMVDAVNQIVDKSIELNYPPYDLIDILLASNNAKMHVNFLETNETGTPVIENMIYLLEFNQGKNNLAFVINYDWSG